MIRQHKLLQRIYFYYSGERGVSSVVSVSCIEGAGPVDRGRVLIIDADRRTVDRLQEMFLQSGFEAEVALSPNVGLNIVNERQMSVAILSAEVACDGDWAVVKGMKQRDPDLPVVLFNAPNEKGLSREARRAGVKRFLATPTDIQAVHNEAIKVMRN